MSLFEIKCPMCKGTIWINPSTGKIVDHKSADHKKIDLNDFLKTQKERGSKLEQQFKKAKEEQEKRKQEMEEKFKRTKEHPEEFEGDYQSPFQWD
jgi:hypothetical protein